MKLNELLFSETNDRVFVFQSCTKINTKKFHYIKKNLKGEFFLNWYSHESKLSPKLFFLNNYFIIISTCTSNISGCSIDALTHKIREIGLDLGINFFYRLQIPYFKSNKNQFSYNEINDLKIQFSDYKDFINKYRSNLYHNIFILNTRLTHSDELWIVPLDVWFEKYIKNN